eukprot:s12114_g2.t1
MADAPDPDGAKDGAKDDAAPAATTPPDQGSAMELELCQALIEVSRRKKAEHQAKQITAAMEEAKKAAAKRREEALGAARYAATRRTKADAEPDAMDPGAGQHRPGPRYTSCADGRHLAILERYFR